MNIFLLRIFPLQNIYSWKLLRKIKWQLPGEPLAARYNWCQDPVPGRGPAVEKHCSRGPALPRYRGFVITLGSTPLDEWSARRRDLYLTTHDTRNRQTSTPPPWSEPANPERYRPQTHTLDRVIAGIGFLVGHCHGKRITCHWVLKKLVIYSCYFCSVSLLTLTLIV